MATYWYKHWHTECPICGKALNTKERIFNISKPINYLDRHIYQQHECSGHQNE